MADKHIVIDMDALADEGMRRDLAAPTNACVPLNLDKRADPGVIPDRAFIEVHEAVVFDVLSQAYASENTIAVLDCDDSGHEITSLFSRFEP
jgi:hypothetical protein